MKTNYCKLTLFEKYNHTELKKFFQKNDAHTIFINDIVFIEENKSKFDKKTINSSIENEVFLIFPIFHQKENI